MQASQNFRRCTLKTLQYACDREDPTTGGARCRAPAENNGRCPEHQGDGYVLARPATRVLVKLTVPANLFSPRLIALSEKNNRNFQLSRSNQPKGKAQVVANAEMRGLDPNAYRPNTPDEGTLVVFLAEDNATQRQYQPPRVRLNEILEEIFQHLGMASIQEWHKKGPNNPFLLQVEFSSKVLQETVPDYHTDYEKEIKALMGLIYRTYIYQNPAGPDMFTPGAYYALTTVNANYCSVEADGVLHYTADARWVVSSA